MKRNLLSLIILLAVLFAVSHSQAQTVKKKVAYITCEKTMAATAADVRNDPIIKLLQADANFEVAVFVVTDAGVVDIAGFNLAVVQEGFGSTAGILKPTGSAGLAKFNIPFIYNKVYAFRDGRAVTTGGSPTGGANIAGVAMTVEPANQTNVLFNGITFTDNKFDVFKTTSGNDGGEGIIAMNYVPGIPNLPASSLATSPEIADAATTIFLNDFPSGTSIGSETLSARMIAVGMLFGAICKDNGTNFTQNGITLWRNALYSLAGLTVPTTPVAVTEEEKPISINIDFGPYSNITADAGWNNLFLESNDTQKVSLIDSKGDSTGFVAYFHDVMQGINSGGTSSAAAGLNLPSTASSDNLYVSGDNPTGGITFENLNKNLKYSFEVFASRMGVTDNREAKYTFAGQNTVVGTLNSSDNESGIAEAKDVVPDADGKILLTIEKGDNNTNSVGYIYIGTLRFTSTTLTEINVMESQVSSIKAYPVPFNNQLTISNLTSQSTISLYTVTGSKIYETNANDSQLNINTSGYKPGIYILNVTENGMVKGTFKVVKK